MEHKHFLKINQLYWDFFCYETIFLFDFSSPYDLIVRQSDKNLLNRSEAVKSEIRFPIDPEINSQKEILKIFLIDLLSHVGNFYGSPVFEQSDLIDEEDFNRYKKRGGEIIDERNNRTREAGKNHPLIRYCADHNLYPEPEGTSPHNWQANCPSGRAHHFYLSTHSNTWGCGYCNKKGELDELKVWQKVLNESNSWENGCQ